MLTIHSIRAANPLMELAARCDELEQAVNDTGSFSELAEDAIYDAQRYIEKAAVCLRLAVQHEAEEDGIEAGDLRRDGDANISFVPYPLSRRV